MLKLLFTLVLPGVLLLFPSAASAVGSEFVITITADGFTPQTLSVPLGKEVTFRNLDRENRWPASDPHPIHDDYPAFDPMGPIASASSWTFTPTKAGTWRYHDHLRPHKRGILIVTKGGNVLSRMRETFSALSGLLSRVFRLPFTPFSFRSQYGLRLKEPGESVDAYVISQMKICAAFGNRHPCYKELTEVFLRQFTTLEILEAFKRTESNPDIYARCHEVGHYLGRRAYRLKGSIKEAYAQCPVMVCGVGCQHGAAEEYFREHNASITTPDEVLGGLTARACGDEKSYDRQILYHECLHGLGHGLMTYTDMDLPRSLRLCDAFPTQWDREGCYAGAFMENSTSFTSTTHPTRYLKKDDPLYPCNSIDAKYMKLCYQYQSSYFGELTSWDWQKTAAFCRMVPPAYQLGCFNQVATNQAVAVRDPATVKKLCDNLKTPSDRDFCVEEVVSTYGGRFIDEPKFMLDFCAIVDEANKKTCYTQMGALINYWGKSMVERTEVCSMITNKQHRSWCMVVVPGKQGKSQ